MAGHEAINFYGWFWEEDKLKGKKPRLFTVWVRKEDGSERLATEEDLRLAGYVPVEEVEEARKFAEQLLQRVQFLEQELRSWINLARALERTLLEE